MRGGRQPQASQDRNGRPRGRPDGSGRHSASLRPGQ